MHTTRGACLAFLCLIAACSSRWESPYDAGGAGWLMSVWGPSENELLAVGGTPTRGALYRLQDDGYEAVPLGLDVPLLNWIHGFERNDATIVGNGGTILHWNGTVAMAQASPSTQDLWGVWGSSPSDLWAVGGNGRNPGEATLLHFDGTSWQLVPLPVLQRPNVYALYKVWGSAPSDVWVVGQRGVVLRFDGSSWREELVGASDDLIAVWGTDADHVAMVGGRSNGVIASWNGSAFSIRPLAPLPCLNGVWMREPSVVHVVGVDGTTAVVDFESLEADAHYLDTSDDLHSVFGDANGQLTTVGGNLEASADPFRGVVYRRRLQPGE